MLHHLPVATPRRTIWRSIEVVVLAFVVALMLAALAMMARVPTSTGVEPRPMPAPGPLAMIEFRELALPDQAGVVMVA